MRHFYAKMSKKASLQHKGYILILASSVLQDANAIPRNLVMSLNSKIQSDPDQVISVLREKILDRDSRVNVAKADATRNNDLHLGEDLEVLKNFLTEASRKPELKEKFKSFAQDAIMFVGALVKVGILAGTPELDSEKQKALVHARNFWQKIKSNLGAHANEDPHLHNQIMYEDGVPPMGSQHHGWRHAGLFSDAATYDMLSRGYSFLAEAEEIF